MAREYRTIINGKVPMETPNKINQCDQVRRPGRSPMAWETPKLSGQSRAMPTYNPAMWFRVSAWLKHQRLGLSSNDFVQTSWRGWDPGDHTREIYQAARPPLSELVPLESLKLLVTSWDHSQTSNSFNHRPHRSIKSPSKSQATWMNSWNPTHNRKMITGMHRETSTFFQGTVDQLNGPQRHQISSCERPCLTINNQCDQHY